MARFMVGSGYPKGLPERTGENSTPIAGRTLSTLRQRHTICAFVAVLVIIVRHYKRYYMQLLDYCPVILLYLNA